MVLNWLDKVKVSKSGFKITTCLLFSEGIKASIVEDLKKRGHDMVEAEEGISIVQGVKKVMDKVEAYSDYRKGGRAAVFDKQR